VLCEALIATDEKWEYVVVNVVTPLKLYPRHGSTPDLQGLARDVVDAGHQAAGIIWS